ncbi:MAG TPA: hypothetical protein DCE41_24590 [Cytophagales bacterium]|nr:hypothetical protein [Cytophagales bacterium]HAA20075.1 hypothetical protein [Cytophagales bacterium]HAP62289.1 hypothetical protein [Cytophagales bacterium]
MSTKQVSLQAVSNNQYVSADQANPQDVYLVANREVRGPWETFDLEILPEISPNGNRIIALKASNGQYVKWLPSEGNKLSTKSSNMAPEDKFEVIWEGIGVISLKASNGNIVLSSQQTGLVLKAIGDQSGIDSQYFLAPV